MRLLPDNSGLIAWSTVLEGRPQRSAGEAEAEASAVLRTHLGRLRKTGNVIVASGDDGETLLYVKVRPDDEHEWLAALAGLLNEAEVMRNALSGSVSARQSGAMHLFSGRT